MTKANNKEIFETLSIPKAVKQMALPTIFSQIIILIYNMADTLYLGKTDNAYMVAGAALILPVFNICLSLAGLTGIGGGALISRLLGIGKDNEAKKVSCFCLYLSICITAVFSLLTFIFMSPLLNLLGASENTFNYARQYALCVIVIGGIPTVLSNVMSNLLRSVGESGKAGLGIAMGGVLNIILDPLFMFVLLPRGNEVLGVGIATLISNCLACIYFFIVIFGIRKTAPVSFNFRVGMPEKSSIVSIFYVGFPSAITTLLFDIDYIVIDKLMASYGDFALAAVGIVLKAERLPLNVGIGICQGMMPIVAYNYSSKNYKRMFGTIKFSLILGLIVSAVSIGLYEIFSAYIMKAFIDEAQTVALGTEFLRIRCLATPLMFMSFFTVYVFQGFGKGNYSLTLGVTRWAVFNIPMLFILNQIIGMYGLVWSQVCADILTVILSFTLFYKYIKSLRQGSSCGQK